MGWFKWVDAIKKKEGEFARPEAILTLRTQAYVAENMASGHLADEDLLVEIRKALCSGISHRFLVSFFNCFEREKFLYSKIIRKIQENTIYFNIVHDVFSTLLCGWVLDSKRRKCNCENNTANSGK